MPGSLPSKGQVFAAVNCIDTLVVFLLTELLVIKKPTLYGNGSY